MKLSKLSTALIVVLILACSCYNQAFAIDENYAAPQLRGNQIRKDSFSVVADTVYFNPLLKPTQTTHSVRNLITFRIDESSNKKLPDKFAVYLEIKVYYKKQSGVNTVLDSTGTLYLKAAYDKNAPYHNRSIQTFTGGYEAKVVIKNVVLETITNIADVEEVLILENEVFVGREYQFSCTGNAVSSVASDADEVFTHGELKVSWGKDRAADEYDLEWTYIDESALSDYGTTPNFNANAIFNRNATRVSITSTQYRIPLLYEMKGRLFFRVRAVQVKSNGQRVESNWSSDNNNTAGLGNWQFDGHDGNFNWQASTSFAEEGKRKSVVQYFDGSLRNRQTITKDNTTGKTIIAENFYDFQGRPVIQVLPAPSLSNIIKYTPRFNAAINGAEYEKTMYDQEMSMADACENGAPALDSASGTSQYYSASNPLANTGMHQYLPKAKGYPFTEVRYLPDNTSRVSRQSGVGEVFQIGQRATRYYYGAAEQEELDALFGTEVGNNSHYFKNMVRDANGQYSVSYVDMLGRTIATALAGDSVMKMQKLASNKEFLIKKNLLDAGNNIIKGTILESSRSLLVPRQGDYVFKYSLIPDSLTIKDCENLPVCYDCRYDLEITITDECGNAPRIIKKTNVSVQEEINCGAIRPFPSVDTTFNLAEGNYLITKKLSINKAAMDYYRTVFLDRNTCKTFDTFLEEQRTAIGTISCEPSCVTCTAQLGDPVQFTTNYFNALGVPESERTARAVEATLAYNRLKRDCDALCGRVNYSQNVREMMLADVTPPAGQYANPTQVDTYSIFDILVGPVKNYQAPFLLYKDEKGVRELVNFLPEDQFIERFKLHWAETLLPFHPEYNKLLKYEEIEAQSNGWEYGFQQTDTYAEAVTKGFLNPANFSGLPATPPFVHNIAFKDPIFDILTPTQKGYLKDSLDKKAKDENNVFINAWSLATIMAHCKEKDSSCFNSYKIDNQAFNLGADCTGELDIAWRYFREFYLQERRELIQRIVDAVPYVDNVTKPLPPYFLHFNLPAAIPSEIQYATNDVTAEQKFKEEIENNCRALAVQWIKDLALCSLTTQQRDAMIERMVQVCKEGGDAQHIYGASTVKPSSTLVDRSFEQVMRNVLGSNYNNNCNVYLIGAPKAYGVQPALGEKPLYNKPDSCECSTISGLYGAYTFRKTSGETFSDYLYRTSGTRIRQGVLDTLRKACNGEINCNFLKEPIMLAPVLQCGVKEVCIDCHAIDTLYSKFRKEFPGIVPSKDDTASAQRSKNQLFEKYMNHHLGFGKTTVEYLTFLDSCKIAYGLVDTLDQIQQAFRNDRQQSYGVITTYKASNTESYSDLKDLTRNGLLLLPDSIRQRNTGGYHFITISQQTPATWCWQNGFAIEGKFKLLKRTAVDTGFSINAGNNVRMQFRLFKNSFTYNSVTYGPGLYLAGIKDTSGAQYGAVYGGTGFDFKRLTADTNALQNWNMFKLVIRPGYYDLYWNGKLIHHTVCSPAITLYNSSFVTLGLPGGQGALDYVRFSDLTNVRYYEEYENATIPAIASAAYFCPATVPDCQTAFVTYYNQQRGTSLNYNQISSLYGSAGLTLTACSVASGNTRQDTLNTWLSDYKKYGGVPHLDASGADTTKWRPNYGGDKYTLGVPLGEVIRNGVFALPKYYADTTRGKRTSFDLDYYDTLCLPAEGFDFVFKAKLPDSLINSNWLQGQFLITLYPIPPASRVQTSFNYIGDGAAVCAVATDPLPECTRFPVPFQSFNEWRTVKWEFRGNRFRYYIDSFLLAERPLVNPFTTFKFLTITPYSQFSQIDYVRFVDVSGRVLFNEEFDDPFNLAVPDRSMKCGGCEVDFTKYFNQRNGTQLTYAAIVAQLRQSGITETPCPRSGLTLCGKTEPVFPSIIPKQHQPCNDSLMFAVSTATIWHEFYRDSLLNSFDDKYLAKCLAVKATEQFTVEHNVNEYHYTLYYYDLAGNLVKTVPPAGVDISKFQWADAWSDSVKLARRNKVLLTPKHKQETEYRYNTLNLVVEQKSPDDGVSEFYHDRMGRVSLSQNAKQKNAVTATGEVDWNYSYSKYDVLGRISEAGEIKNLVNKEPITREMVKNKDHLAQWFIDLSNRRSQVKSTLYDIAYEGLSGETAPMPQINLRNKVSAIFLSTGSNTSLYSHATFYTYDVHGNVNKLMQDYGLSGYAPNIMNANGNRFKLIEYDYDVISGKVNQVKYQAGWADQFYHRYKYDAENRLTIVETSLDGFVWQKDAQYEYYAHGPLARTILGDQSVQGVDFAYTLQGWLKGVNSSGATSLHDMGGDGSNGSLNRYTARDAFGFSLNYFTAEYQPINENKNPFPGYSSQLGTRHSPLYNGSITSMASAIRRFEDRGTYEDGANLFFNYRYDQLNRLVSMDTDTGFNVATNTFTVLNTLRGFKERIAYDGNGNIQTYFRNNKGWDGEMDDLAYKYYPGTNRLRQVTDQVPANKWGVNSWDPVIDIDNQSDTSNYRYDEIGNMIKDSSENIWNIKWNVYGLIDEISRYATARNPVTKIKYIYDAAGQRIGKISESATDKAYTWYVRDAQGNLLSVYDANGTATDLSSLFLNQSEKYIYGSSRLGTETKSQGVDGGPWDAGQYYSNGLFERGRRQYELTNHLGNIITVISDKKYGISSNGTVIDYFEPDMLSATEYYPFGMPMRIAGSSTGKNYRFGYNGKENDNEVKGGEGLQQDFGNRIYDTRLGRWFSVDPLQSKYPGLSSYNFVSNSPLNAVDPDGRLIIFINGLWGPGFLEGGGTIDYWGKKWTKDAMKRIGDNKALFIDGSLGGSKALPVNNLMGYRVNMGLHYGYKNAAALWSQLDKDETIKIITNSMGTAFERGYTLGLMKYQAEENIRRKSANREIEKRLEPLIKKKESLTQVIEKIPDMEKNAKSNLMSQIDQLNSQINNLESQKKELINFKIEMVIDLSSHQVDLHDPFAEKNYYMQADENMTELEKIGVDEQSIKTGGAYYLGKMGGHHASYADTNKFPESKQKQKAKEKKK